MPLALPATLPATLSAWRLYKGSRDELWSALEPFFFEQGLSLFVGQGPTKFAPTNDVRTSDGYHHWIPDIGPSQTRFFTQKTIHAAARSTEGKDVLIRLVVKGEEGAEHLRILRTLAASGVLENHALPLLAELKKDDMVFAVFPLVATNDHVPWFFTISELLDLVHHVLQAFSFLHTSLIAHRDFGSGEVLINFAGGPWSSGRYDGPPPPPFRSLFPVQYWLNDFELSIQFDSTSDPSTRLVRGIPISTYGIDDGQEYVKQIAPEALEDEPYCPFKADVYQVGWYLCELIVYSSKSIPEVFELTGRMTVTLPSERLSFAEALARFEEIRGSISDETKMERVQPRHFSGSAAHIKQETLSDPPTVIAEASVPGQREEGEGRPEGPGE